MEFPTNSGVVAVVFLLLFIFSTIAYTGIGALITYQSQPIPVQGNIMEQSMKRGINSVGPSSIASKFLSFVQQGSLVLSIVSIFLFVASVIIFLRRKSGISLF